MIISFVVSKEVMCMVIVALTMLAVGVCLGFVGAGGSGFIISILTTIFGFSIHTALGTALSAMFFSSISGAISHYREGNTILKVGIPVGLIGSVGAWISSEFSAQIDSHILRWMTAGILLLSAIILWVRMILISRKKEIIQEDQIPKGSRFWLAAITVGFVTGVLSGLFGIGSTPFIQIGLMILFGMSVRKSAGTTMLVIIPIALAGGADNYRLGYLDIKLLIAVVIGTMIGSYIGAKFTKRVPELYLKIAMVLVPTLGAVLLVL